MSVIYDDFAETFASSRKNLKWPEISYLLEQISQRDAIIDIACGSWRLISWYQDTYWSMPDTYIWLDASENILIEARKPYPWFIFFHGNMENQDIYTTIKNKTKNTKKHIFCIAGFHHINDIWLRWQILSYWYDTLNPWEKVCMTNWALESQVNKDTYKSAMIHDTENEFWSHDFSIKIGKYTRWYHSFTLAELEYLADSAGFTILENRLSESEKNFITILEK